MRASIREQRELNAFIFETTADGEGALVQFFDPARRTATRSRRHDMHRAPAPRTAFSVPVPRGRSAPCVGEQVIRRFGGDRGLGRVALGAHAR